MDLSETTDKLLSSPEKTADWLALADDYMQRYNENPDMFVLPKMHMFLLPLLETYAKNCQAYLQYLVGIRDSFQRNSMYYKEVQMVYRRINGRCVQQMRRERLGRAIAKAEAMYGRTDFHTRLKWSAQLEKKWAQRRIKFLNDARGGKRMNVEDRAELLAEFWDIIDTEIADNIGIPTWD